MACPEVFLAFRVIAFIFHVGVAEAHQADLITLLGSYSIFFATLHIALGFVVATEDLSCDADLRHCLGLSKPILRETLSNHRSVCCMRSV